MSQIVIDFSPSGLKDGFKGAMKVIGYHVVTDVLGVATLYLSNVSVTTHNAEQAGILAASIAVGNALIKFLKDWLGTTQVPVVEEGISSPGDTSPMIA